MAQKVINIGTIQGKVGSNLNVSTSYSTEYCLTYSNCTGTSIVSSSEDSANNALYVNGYSVGVGSSYQSNQLVCEIDTHAKFRVLNSLSLDASQTAIGTGTTTVTLIATANYNTTVIDFPTTVTTGTTSATVNPTYTNSATWITIVGNSLSIAANTGTTSRSAVITASTSYKGVTKTATISLLQIALTATTTYSQLQVTGTPIFATACATSPSGYGVQERHRTDTGSTTGTWSTWADTVAYTISPTSVVQNTSTATVTTNFTLAQTGTFDAKTGATFSAAQPIGSTTAATSYTKSDKVYSPTASLSVPDVAACFEGVPTAYTYTENFTAYTYTSAATITTFAACFGQTPTTAITSTTVTSTAGTEDGTVTGWNFENVCNCSVDSIAASSTAIILGSSVTVTVTTNGCSKCTNKWYVQGTPSTLYDSGASYTPTATGSVVFVSNDDTSKTTTLTVNTACTCSIVSLTADKTTITSGNLTTITVNTNGCIACTTADTQWYISGQPNTFYASESSFDSNGRSLGTYTLVAKSDISKTIDIIIKDVDKYIYTNSEKYNFFIISNANLSYPTDTSIKTFMTQNEVTSPNFSQPYDVAKVNDIQNKTTLETANYYIGKTLYMCASIVAFNSMSSPSQYTCKQFTLNANGDTTITF